MKHEIYKPIGLMLFLVCVFGMIYAVDTTVDLIKVNRQNPMPVYIAGEIRSRTQFSTDESVEHKFGHNHAITGGQEEDVWTEGDDYTFSSAAEAHWVSSSDDGDDEEITIEGLDVNWAEVTETVDLTGQTPAALSTSLIRVNRAYNSDSTALDGDIYVLTTDTLTAGVPDTQTAIKAKIDNGDEQTQQLIYSVPAGKTMFLETWETNSDAKTDFQLHVREFGKVFRIQAHRHNAGGSSNFVFSNPRRILAKSDVKMRAAALANTDVGGHFGFLLMDDD